MIGDFTKLIYSKCCRRGEELNFTNKDNKGEYLL